MCIYKMTSVFNGLQFEITVQHVFGHLVRLFVQQENTLIAFQGSFQFLDRDRHIFHFSRPSCDFHSKQYTWACIAQHSPRLLVLSPFQRGSGQKLDENHYSMQKGFGWTKQTFEMPDGVQKGQVGSFPSRLLQIK